MDIIDRYLEKMAMFKLAIDPFPNSAPRLSAANVPSTPVPGVGKGFAGSVWPDFASSMNMPKAAPVSGVGMGKNLGPIGGGVPAPMSLLRSKPLGLPTEGQLGLAK